MIMPAAFYPPTTVLPTEFDITAAAGSNSHEGYGDTTYTAIFAGSGPLFGSITDTTSPDGGVIHAVTWAGGDLANRVSISTAGTGISKIFIDGTEYTLGSPFSYGGMKTYAFGGSTQRIFTGTTYTIGLLE